MGVVSWKHAPIKHKRLLMQIESRGIAGDFRVIAIRLADGLEVALRIADDLARLGLDKRAARDKNGAPAESAAQSG